MTLNYFSIPYYRASDRTSFSAIVRSLKNTSSIVIAHWPGMALRHQLKGKSCNYCLSQCNSTSPITWSVCCRNYWTEITAYGCVFLCTLSSQQFQRTMCEKNSNYHLQFQRTLVRKQGKLSLNIAAGSLSDKTVTYLLGATTFASRRTVNYPH